MTAEYATMRLLDSQDIARYTGETIDLPRADIQVFDNMRKIDLRCGCLGELPEHRPAHIITPIGLQIDVLDIYTDSWTESQSGEKLK